MIAPPIIVYATIVCPVTHLCQEKTYRGQYLFFYRKGYGTMDKAIWILFVTVRIWNSYQQMEQR